MNKILYIADTAAGGGGKADPRDARIANLEAQLAKYKQADAEHTAEEKIISEKMAAGLSRKQAIAVIARQKEFDARQADRRARIQEYVNGLGTLSDADRRAAIQERFTDASSDEKRIKPVAAAKK